MAKFKIGDKIWTITAVIGHDDIPIHTALVITYASEGGYYGRVLDKTLGWHSSRIGLYGREIELMDNPNDLLTIQEKKDINIAKLNLQEYP